MKFEHIIEVNQGIDTSGMVLNRKMLWDGLLARAEDARPFIQGLDECRIVSRGENILQRELYFGKNIIKDTVTFASLQWIRFESDVTDEQIGGTLTISIEEPEQDKLYLRFNYVTSLDETSEENKPYIDFVCSAYYQADIDTLNVIRTIFSSSKT